jgi:hypothetical protein
VSLIYLLSFFQAPHKRVNTTHAQTQTCAHTLTHTHTHAHTRTHMHTHEHTHTQGSFAIIAANNQRPLESKIVYVSPLFLKIMRAPSADVVLGRCANADTHTHRRTHINTH